MILIDDMDDDYPWAFAYCNVVIGASLTQGVGAFYINLSSPLPAGRIWLTRFGTYPNLSVEKYLVIDAVESQHKTWEVNIADVAGVRYQYLVEESGGHLVCDLDLAKASINLSQVAEISIGAIAPLDIAYTAVLDNMRTEAVVPPPIQFPPSVSVSPAEAAITIGQQIDLTASPTGGVSPYNIAWYNEAGQTVGSGTKFTFQGTQIGTFKFYANVTDAQGATATSNMATIRVTEEAPPLPPEEPTPPNTSHMSVVGNEVRPLHIGLWYPWFLDTSSGWLPAVGERWVDENYAIWSEERLRAILRDIRDIFKCNMVRVFFWADWVLTNSRATMSPYYPTSEIGNRDALHALCRIANEEGLDVELRMWDWNPTEGRTGNPLQTHTVTEFINAWIQIAQWFSVYPNVCFNLYDEACEISLSSWLDLAYRALMAIRQAGIGHVVYVHWMFCGGEGIDWIRQFGNHYQLAFSRHEYIYHGTTEAMHQDTINIKNEGYPTTITASGVYNENPSEINTYREWYTELLNNNIGISFYTYGRPNVMGFRIQLDTPFPCPPNTVGTMWIEVTSGITPPPSYNTLIINTTSGGTTTPIPGRYDYEENATAVVTALPNVNYRFVHWELDTTIRTENPIAVTMDRDYSLRAIFEYVPPPPTVATINGVVTDKATGLPLAEATVTCDGYASLTEVNGAYIFENIPAQQYTIEVSKTGYQTQTITIDASVGGTITLPEIQLVTAPPTPDNTATLALIGLAALYFLFGG